MKSTKAMRDRIRELIPKAWDDYDRAVDCVLEDLETSLVRIEALEAALRRIARQHLSDEMHEDLQESADWQGGCDIMVGIARAALAPEQDK